MALPDVGDVARMRRIIARVRSYGVEVREMPGWETRGFRFPAVPTRIFDHHDASSRKSGEWGSLGLILDGTPRGIPGPLSNFQVARCLDGVPKVAVVAAGYTYHAGTGGPYAELRLNNANPATYGTEKANDGLGEPYTSAANYATNALFHACAVESGAIPASFPVGHKEWTSRKSDPVYSMADRRRQVGAFTPTLQEDELSQAQVDQIIRHLEAGTNARLIELIDALRSGAGRPLIGYRSDPDQTDEKGTPGDGAMYVGGVGTWVHLGPRYPELHLGIGTVGKFHNVPPNEIAYWKSFWEATKTSPGTSPAVSGLTAEEIADAVNDDADQRARDGDPTTGPLS